MDSESDCPRKEEFNKVDWSVDHTPRVSCLNFSFLFEGLESELFQTIDLSLNLVIKNQHTTAYVKSKIKIIVNLSL